MRAAPRIDTPRHVSLRVVRRRFAEKAESLHPHRLSIRTASPVCSDTAVPRERKSGRYSAAARHWRISPEASVGSVHDTGPWPRGSSPARRGIPPDRTGPRNERARTPALHRGLSDSTAPQSPASQLRIGMTAARADRAEASGKGCFSIGKSHWSASPGRFRARSACARIDRASAKRCWLGTRPGFSDTFPSVEDSTPGGASGEDKDGGPAIPHEIRGLFAPCHTVCIPG
jgi:hypothetical protein